MTTKDRIIEGKRERQRTMDKLSVNNSRAYTYDPESGSGCGERAKPGDERNERKAKR